MQAVTRNTASRSWALSPMEMTFFRAGQAGRTGLKNRPSSAAKARSFHSKGEGRSGRSYSDRAESILTDSKHGSNSGKNRWQLNSIQPLSALVTTTTVPCFLANRNVSAASTATSDNRSRCHWFTDAPSSKRNPCRCTQLEGSIVSSQSNTNRVCSLENLTSSATAADWSQEDAAAEPSSTADVWVCIGGGGSGLVGTRGAASPSV
mmetsp:Transcript_14536/g.38732  ORF Transcript_14536/g.38732 Transcript_14536/m.38732 type:complete len:206 (-) Transcript_14536:371-988(-)